MSLPMEKAAYSAKAIGASFGMTDDKKPQLAIQFEVVDEQFAGESIAAILYFTEKAVDRTLESLVHLGFASDDLELLADIGRDQAAELLPNVVEIVCEPEEYDGAWRLKLRWINRSGGGKFAFKNKLEGGDLKSFAAQMRGALKNARGPQARKPAAAKAGGSRPSQPHPNAPGNSDDIPF